MHFPHKGYTEIPQEFHSFDSKGKFEHCIECDKYLLGDETDYFIEKAVKKYQGFSAHDVIFEYAICLQCAERMRKSMSKESMQSLESYFAQNVNVLKRMELMSSESENPDDWMNECLVTGKNRSELNEYQIFAQCKGDKMVLGQMPYLVSGETLEAVAALLSAETLDELDNFSKRHFGPPPGLEKELPYQRVLIV
ncbi:hypothetical protein [Fulvivirga lutea]|uniref:Uncharacterized protein n=1 Tax=Fulvivirga lutea TaxID=2810512 RepID=A0A974WDB9_9BACT|nr:hypothetical protein [Fulvivirga lutea]QSE95879.1 hypothetical protein JR347_09625 [Fulvivirga lutea]